MLALHQKTAVKWIYLLKLNMGARYASHPWLTKEEANGTRMLVVGRNVDIPYSHAHCDAYRDAGLPLLDLPARRLSISVVAR